MLEDKANRVCQFCKKTFCCTKCRDRHVDKVHPGLDVNCSLCASKILPIRQFEFEKLDLRNEKLLCHIVDKHLPLHCELCGDLFKSREDFKTFDLCKSQYWNPLTSPMRFEYLGKKLKHSMSDSDYNDSRFHTPPEIYRKTSTPMLVDQKANFETPCVPNFSLKTPRTNSPLIGKNNVILKLQESQSNETRNTEYFSFSAFSNEGTTPFRIGRNEHFFGSNSGKKLDIMEERDEIAKDKVSSPTDMDLTNPKGGLLQSSLKSGVTSEESDRTPDIVKKVRFSDQHETVSQFENPMELSVNTILNMSAEDEEFQNANDASNIRNANIEDTKDIEDTLDTKITENTEDTEDTKESQVVNRRHFVLKSLENSPSDSQIEIILENTRNEKAEVNNNTLSGQQNSNKVLMMVLVENNSKGLNTDLIPFISSGLKKMQEQFASTNSQPSSSTTESSNTTNVHSKSVTKMKMSVESYSMDNLTTDHREVASSSSSSHQTNESGKSNGFLSVVAQVMKNALKSFSGLRIPASSVVTTEVVHRQETVEESSQESSADVSSSNLASNIQARSGKRAREITEVSSKVDTIALAMEVGSPLAKRHRGWYKMVRARQPIRRMRNSHVITSPRRVSTETQVFRQGSLTVGDTVLPLPTRAHQSTQTESDNSLFDKG